MDKRMAGVEGRFLGDNPQKRSFLGPPKFVTEKTTCCCYQYFLLYSWRLLPPQELKSIKRWANKLFRAIHMGLSFTRRFLGIIHLYEPVSLRFFGIIRHSLTLTRACLFLRRFLRDHTSFTHTNTGLSLFETFFKGSYNIHSH